MKFSSRSVLLALATIEVLAAAAMADDPAPQIINNPSELWGVWGMGASAKTDIRADPDANIGQFRRVSISSKPAQPWDVGGWDKIFKPVQKGDVLLVSFWARAEVPPAGNDFIVTNGRIVETGPAAVGVTPDTTFSIGTAWKQYYVWGTAAKDYPVGTIQVTVVVGGDVQVLDLGPVQVVDYGPGYDLTKLPQN